MKKKKLGPIIRKARKDMHLTLRGIEAMTKGKLNNMWISTVETKGSYKRQIDLAKLRMLCTILNLDYLSVLIIAGYATIVDLDNFVGKKV